jgi:hypothetical protein
MTTILFFECFLIGLLGIAFQTMIKIKLLNDKAKAANVAFKVKDYFTQDYPTIILNLIVLCVCILSFDEIMKFKPAILDYVKFFYFFVGFTGAAIFNALLSNVNKKLMKTIDEKTNVADGMESQNKS